MDGIILVLLLQIYLAVALNLWGDVFVNMIVLYFRRIYNCKKTKLVFIYNLRLIRYVYSILHLRLDLGLCLKANLSTLAKTVVLPLQPILLMVSSNCILKVTPNPLWYLPNLK